ncbi:MAG: hypothetical protein KBS70_03470 [Bacteroidales bacterium]|nr:hypothetical protein [Candidatus Colicola equi]
MKQATGINDLLAFGDNRQVVRNVIRCYEQWRDMPADIVQELRGLDVEDQCRSIFAYLVANTNYLLDPAGVQYIKSPARLLKDGAGDCKSLTLFIASCLHCLGIRHTIRFVNFDGGLQYTHVYPIAYREDGSPIILDACEMDATGQPIFNYARPFKKKKEFSYN